MSRAAQVILLTIAIFCAYVWLNISWLSPYSLQAFAGCVLAYFLLKKANNSGLWPVLPQTTADEMTLAIFTILLLIGSTGFTSSLFFPLIYLYLFFLSISLDVFTAISISLELILFFYAQGSNFSPAEISHLISLPLVLIFFLFTKHQYQQAKKQQQLAAIESEQLEQVAQALDQENQWQNYIVSFIQQFLRPSLDVLQDDQNFETDIQTTKQQLQQLQLELDKLMHNLAQHQDKQHEEN